MAENLTMIPVNEPVLDGNEKNTWLFT
jgi:hypothetical protein